MMTILITIDSEIWCLCICKHSVLLNPTARKRMKIPWLTFMRNYVETTTPFKISRLRCCKIQFSFFSYFQITGLSNTKMLIDSLGARYSQVSAGKTEMSESFAVYEYSVATRTPWVFTGFNYF